jgi:hypothetical protein
MFDDIERSFTGLGFNLTSESLGRFSFEANGQCAANTACHEVIAVLNKLKNDVSDEFEFIVEFDGAVLTLGNQSDVAEVASHFVGFDAHEGHVVYSLVILKGQGRSTAIYSLQAFGKSLVSQSLAASLASLASRFNEGLILRCYGIASPKGSATIQFVPLDFVVSADAAHDAGVEREQKLELFRDSSFNRGAIRNFLPTDFFMLSPTGNEHIDGFMGSACSALSTIFIANTSELHDDDTLHYRVVGYKSIEDTIGIDALVPAVRSLHKLYSWAYGDGGTARADKIGLARNVLSLCVNRIEDIEAHSEIWNALTSNYQIYLKGNISAYLDVKSRIADFLVESTSKAHAIAESLAETLRNSLYVMLTFLLTVVVVNGLKDSGSEMIFSLQYLTVVVILTAALTAWVMISGKGVIARFDEISNTSSDVLFANYERLLLREEIEEAIDPIRKRNRVFLVSQVNRYRFTWLICVSILIAGFGLGFWLFSLGPMKADGPKSVSTSHEQSGTLIDESGVAPIPSESVKDQPKASPRPAKAPIGRGKEEREGVAQQSPPEQKSEEVQSAVDPSQRKR